MRLLIAMTGSGPLGIKRYTNPTDIPFAKG